VLSPSVESPAAAAAPADSGEITVISGVGYAPGIRRFGDPAPAAPAALPQPSALGATSLSAMIEGDIAAAVRAVQEKLAAAPPPPPNAAALHTPGLGFGAASAAVAGLSGGGGGGFGPVLQLHGRHHEGLEVLDRSPRSAPRAAATASQRSPPRGPRQTS